MKKLKFRDIKELAQCLIVTKLHSEDLTSFVGLRFFFLAHLELFCFLAYFIHFIMFCHFLSF